MNLEQRVVAIGALSGIAAMAVSIAILTWLLSAPTEIGNTVSERLTYGLGANVFALLPFFFMLAYVGNSRFLSDAIDPTRHAESRRMEIDANVVDNTLQQNFVFFIASMALSTVVPFEYIQAVWACALVFVVARCAFWIGYRMHPLFRAPGMSATAYMNLALILYVLFKVFT